MRHFSLLIGIVLLGAAILSPVVAALGLDPVPGDIAFAWGDLHIAVPVAYSLCASAGLGLLYYLLKR